MHERHNLFVLFNELGNITWLVFFLINLKYKMKRNLLTPKQEKFCNSYIELGNASEAYRSSYSYMNMKDSTIHRKAIELLNNGKITARVAELQAELKKSSDIKKEWILEELSAIIFADIRDYVSFNGKQIKFKPFEQLSDAQAKAVESIKQTKTGIELKLHGKSWSIERISKMLGFDEPFRTMNEHTLKSELEGLTDEELEAIILNEVPLGQDDVNRD